MENPDYAVETVPFAAYEAQAERNVRTVKYMVLGWVLSVIALCLMVVLCLRYTDEVVTETTETTAEVIQDADNDGANYYAGGDMDGIETDGQENSQADNNGQGG